MSARDVVDIALKDSIFYRQSGGGLTVSGGEPLAQHGFLLEILRLAKENGLHTCVETSGHAPTERLLSIVPYVDLFLYDYKESDDEKHIKSTGVPQKLIIDNLSAIDKAGAKTILRCPIIPNMNDREAHLHAIAETANGLRNIVEVNIMPYHPMGQSKAKRIGREYVLSEQGFPTDGEVVGWIERVKEKTDVAIPCRFML
jgi:pyruvate formate lyase activating enzyme